MANRLLGCAHAALGQRDVACDAAERAAAEAAGARYVWLELASLREMVGRCEGERLEGVLSRLHVIARRLMATDEQLAAVLGDLWPPPDPE